MATDRDEESCRRLVSYAEWRRGWAESLRRPGWADDAKTQAYDALTKLWFAMSPEERKIAGADAWMRYHV